MGCYSFANHVLAGFPEYPAGHRDPHGRSRRWRLPSPRPGAPTEVVLAAGLRRRGRRQLRLRRGRRRAAAAPTSPSSSSATRPGCSAAAPWARATTPSRSALPGVQRELVEALVATGTPVVMVLLTGRPYAIGWALDGTQPRPAAVLQAFFPGEGGGLAIADIITGAVNPSGRLPVSLPRSAGAQPYSYLQPDPRRARPTSRRPTRRRCVRSASACRTPPSPTPTSSWTTASSRPEAPSRAAVTVTNTGPVAGADVVQLYGHDVIGSVVRPVAQLLGYARVELAAGECRRVTLRGADHPARVLRPSPWCGSSSPVPSRCGSPRTPGASAEETAQRERDQRRDLELRAQRGTAGPRHCHRAGVPPDHRRRARGDARATPGWWIVRMGDA